MWPSNPPRIKAFTYRGCRRYLITTTTCFRARHFSITEHARTLSSKIPPFFAARHFEVLAYSVMPDHMHLLRNPVRAGLVKTARDYRWSGSLRFTVAELEEYAGQWTPDWKR
jgi:REP element-mobilizing transposase RayT